MNYKNACLFSAFLAVCYAAPAETVYFGGSLIGDTINSGNSWNTASNWLLEDKSEYGKVPQEGDNIVIDGNYITFDSSTPRLFVTSSAGSFGKLTLQNLNSGTTSKYIQLATPAANTLTFSGIDFIRNANSGSAVIGLVTTVSTQATIVVNGDVNAGSLDDVGVKGNLEFGAGGDQTFSGWGGPKKLIVSGDLNLYGTNCNFNVGVGSENGNSGNATYDNPDISIGGVFNMAYANGRNPTVYLNQRGSGASNGLRTKYILNTVIGVGGLQGNGVITNNTNNNSYNWGKGSATIVFNNAKGSSYTFSGQINDDTKKTSIPTTETVTKLVMRGEGTQILEGETMLFSGGVEVQNGTLKLNYKDATNHGDLTMIGGRFGNVSGSSSTNVNFTNLIYSGGVIESRWDGSSLDVINLSGELKKGDSFGEGDSFLIAISGDLGSMLNSEMKIISWDNLTNATDFSDSDFSLENGEASFAIKSDGLYITVTAVPEPSAVCAVFGVLALAFAYLRRRR